MKHLHTLEEMKQICQQFGEDIDSELCEEVKKSLENCPECRIHYDSIKKVVNIYKSLEEESDIPNNLSDRLIKSLNLK
jgi:hypothetical protein